MNDKHAGDNITNSVRVADANKLANREAFKQLDDLNYSDKNELVIKDSENSNEILMKAARNKNLIFVTNLQSLPGYRPDVQLSNDNSDIMNALQFENSHIPYILNGELYQIQTQDGEAVTVKCNHCPSDRVYRGSIRSTGNFHMHIKRRHPYLLSKLHDMKVNALIERRDRLLRNRKTPKLNRCSRRIRLQTDKMQHIALLTPTRTPRLIRTPPPTRSPTRTPTSATISTSNSESSFNEIDGNQVHKLKIKTVFQRHQQQQKFISNDLNSQQKQQLLPNQGKFVLLNSATSDNNYGIPLNYSLKFAENDGKVTTNIDPVDGCNTSCMSILTAVKADHTEIHPRIEVKTPHSLNHINSSTCTEQILLNNDPPLINKYEHLHFINNEAIDLSLNSNKNYQNLNGFNHYQRDATHTTTSSTTTNCNNKFNHYFTKCQDTLSQIELSLHGVQRALHVRNQIEANRMFLDIAKFKFLYPGFQFN